MIPDGRAELTGRTRHRRPARLIEEVFVPKQHRYTLTVEWTGNRGEGTSSYRSYDRDHEVRAEHAAAIAGSADPAFRGNPSRWNPEQLLIAAASQCHLLSYLHQAAANGVVVVAYVDHPSAVMTEDGKGGGRFTEITLHPLVTITDAGQVELADRLHDAASKSCFVANSLAIPVGHVARTMVRDGS
jgi:organic hydroperoxide reductase OsmC/OhrA